MRVLLLGSGGREHALAWKLAQSPRLEKLFVCPGNPGTAALDPARVENKPIAPLDAPALLDLCAAEQITLCVVGPEQPLVEGVADTLRAAGIAVVGPGRAGAQLEGSKVFSKRFMLEGGIPTAPARIFDRAGLAEARAFVGAHPLPVVIKADGLAAGKGVVVAQTTDEALTALEDMLAHDRFGAAGQQVLVETFMPGKELSYFVLTDGQTAIALPEAQDHKRAYDNDQGPNTGGMGAASPVAWASPDLKATIEDEIVAPTLAALRNQGIDYRGFLFIGLMVGPEGSPRVVEYNCRLGDPETQAILPRMEGDLLALCAAAATDTLADLPLPGLPAPMHSLAVVLAAEGYPAKPKTGGVLTGLAEAAQTGALVFEAGTGAGPTAAERTAHGGRVLAVSAQGGTLAEAQRLAYGAMEQLRLPGSFYRKDIGHQAG